jgi:hypothetical protein
MSSEEKEVSDNDALLGSSSQALVLQATASYPSATVPQAFRSVANNLRVRPNSSPRALYHDARSHCLRLQQSCTIVV